MLGKQKAYRLLLCCCITTLFVAVLVSCSVSQKRRGQGNAQASPEPETQMATGIIIENNTDAKQLQLRELDSDVVMTLTYGAASIYTDKYGEEQEGEKIEQGMILETVYRAEDARLVSASIPKDVWEYQDVRRFTFTSDKGMLQVAGEKYQYSSMTFFASGSESLEPMELNEQDVLTVRGIGIHVYSAVRTSGHGYIRLTNYQDFIGGMAEVSSSMIIPISENMLITVAEGAYRLTLVKGRATATKTVTVRRDEESVVDFSDYKVTAKSIGEILFHIEPDGAALYLNNTPVNYSAPVILNYGKYNITVSLTGYDTYSGVLEVAKPYDEIKVDLIEEKAEVVDSSSSTPSPTTSSNKDTDTVTKKIDSNHTITVSAPEGAEVYLDNVYKGLAPCSFTKVIGSQTITLSKNGYVTKSYSVDILDDDDNVKLSFAELVKDDDEEKVEE